MSDVLMATKLGPLGLPDPQHTSRDRNVPGAYRYTPITKSGGIRLLRLQPSEREGSSIHCSLFHYSQPLNNKFQRSDLYEALSYVWGNALERRRIFVDGFQFEVTWNLHRALEHLRHPVLERILWVDAVCIDQQNDDEKAHQVASMASIYARANRVVVWLGDDTHGGEVALEAIRVANPKALSYGTSGDDQELGRTLVLRLLKNPWFERMWVLQEVAAARQVIMKCGHAEIDGVAFCSGLDSLGVSSDIDSSLKATIRTATHLIRAAPWRSRNLASVSAERFSLDIGPLAELVDMYRNRKATDCRDKIFALLGMSNDNWQGKNARIVADYRSSWDAICEQFFQSLYSREISTHPWRTRGITAIHGRAQILGQLAFDEGEIPQGETLQEVEVRFCGSRSRKAGEKQKWRLQMGANPVRPGDVVCLLQGASRFTIIRPAGVDWIIFRAAVGPPVGAYYMHGTVFPYELELLWDWHIPEPEGTERSSPVAAGPKADSASWRFHLDSAQRLRRLWPVLSVLPTHELLVENLRDTILRFGVALEKSAVDPTSRGAASEMSRFADKLMNEIGSLTAVCLAAEVGKRRVKWSPELWGIEDSQMR
ncbi:heterokaryon incompatibility protein-domain-containing protein [Podospora aff. communis PSN243]|uniref:Heterokaryon incompatibility protein-domain-containing protein n=1 Tax=Podospora aff. communis PSN243 TaxID=3040156 RepID=A0AAV9GF78_9PEZI|nr:heterokaryon incompatibility protein-domain-containing protein [Podospora aff. communis PSN243]